MRPPSAMQLLEVWEAGHRHSPVECALNLLAAATPESTLESLADLSIGQRNFSLLQLRASMFGSALTCFAACSRCGEHVELTFDVVDISVEGAAGATGSVTVQIDDCELEVRIPTSRDLLAVVGSGDIATIRQRLLERCIVTAKRRGEPLPTTELPETVIAAVARRVAEEDAQAEVRLAMTCPTCGQPWKELFDIQAYFWAEIDAWAHRLLHDVHDLAAAYGWSEAEILAMSPLRRRRYLDMVGT
jgi:hypothetical protein